MIVEPIPEKLALRALRIRWVLIAFLGLAFLGACALAVSAWWQVDLAFRWSALAGSLWGYVLWVFWRNLAHNRSRDAGVLLPGIGPGNALTVLRGGLIAALAGFLTLPPPQGWLAWAPGLLYTLAALGDLLDGYAARRSRHATRLGEILDQAFDGVGVLVATLLLVRSNQVPVGYLLVGLARYLFVAGVWLRRRLGRPVYALPENIYRRPLAGVQMGFIFVMLWPVFSPPGTHFAAIAFSFPFLASFALDWLGVSGAFSSRELTRRVESLLYPLRTLIGLWLPVVLRLAVVAAIGVQLAHTGWHGLMAPFSTPTTTLLALEILLTGLLAAGVAARTVAIGGLVMLGIHQFFASFTPLQAALVFVYTAILHLGSGVFSLWSPEKRLISWRAGERDSHPRERGEVSFIETGVLVGSFIPVEERPVHQ